MTKERHVKSRYTDSLFTTQGVGETLTKFRTEVKNNDILELTQ